MTPAEAAQKSRAPLPMVTPAATAGSLDPATHRTNSTGMAFTWSALAGETYQCAVDGAKASACTTSWTADVAGQADGSHVFTIKVRQTGSRPNTYSYTWTVRRSAPLQPTVQQVVSPTRNADVTVTWNDSDPNVASYKCALLRDGATVQAPTSCGGSGTSGTTTFSGLTDNGGTAATYTAQVWAFDNLGNPTQPSSVTPGSVSWQVDAHAPSSPVFVAGSLPVNPTNATGASIQWTDSDFGGGSVTSFACSLDGNVVSVCSASGTAISVVEGTHTFSVQGTDAAGNVGDAASYTWTVITTPPPAPSITSGPAVPVVDVTDATFYFGDSAPGVTFLCSLDSAASTACTSPTTYTNLADGSHSFSVWAKDAAGNLSGSAASSSWQVDTSTSSPVVVSAPQFQSGPSALSNDVNPSLAWVDIDANTDHDVCTLDGTPLPTCTSPMSPSFASDGTADGAHELQVQSVDATGNTSSAAKWDWVLDTRPPAVPAFTNVPANPTANRVASFAFNSDSGAQLTCALDNPAAAVVCASPVSYDGITDGNHTFDVWATDAAGNVAHNSYAWAVNPPPADTTGGSTTSAGTTSGGTTSGGTTSGGTTSGGTTSGGTTSGGTTSGDAGQPGPTGSATSGGATTPVTSPGGSTAPGDTTAPTVSKITTPTTLTGAATATFSEAVKGLNASAARLVVTGSTTAIPAKPVCLNGATVVDCGGQFTVVRLTPVGSLVLGQRYTVVLDTGATHDLAGNASAAASAAFRAARTVEEGNGVVKAAWQKVSSKSAYGSSYVQEHLAGAAAAWTFTGTNVTWWTVTGPTMGKATLLIDGKAKATFNNYAATRKFHVARTVKGLKNAKHTVTIKVLGIKGAKTAKGTFVAVDAFTVGKTRTATPALATTLRSISSKSFLGGHATVADVKGETVTVIFRGTGITWTTMKSVTQGKAAVYVDGKLKATYDDYAAKTAYKVNRSISKLADKVHTLKIVVLGTHHKGGKGNLVTIDRFSVA